jgi:hypothetical protein
VLEEGLQVRAITFQIRVIDHVEGSWWYEILLGRPPDFLPDKQLVDDPGFSEWELMPNVWLQVVEGAPVPENGPIRLGVLDLEESLQRLRDAMGIEIPIFRTPEGTAKYCTFSDPFGNQIGLFQELG